MLWTEILGLAVIVAFLLCAILFHQWAVLVVDKLDRMQEDIDNLKKQIHVLELNDFGISESKKI